MTLVTQLYERNKKWLFFSILAVFIWGMAAHGYAFFDNNLFHDSLNEFDAKNFGSVHKIMLGRIVVPTYRQLFRGDLTIPWFIGLLSLVWIGLAVFFVIKTFCIQSKLSAGLVAGIFVANISFSATAATYIHDLDCNMFAVTCAAAAVFLWKRFSWGWLPGAVMLAGTLGVYQSMIFAAVTLLMLSCILDILDGCPFAQVMLRGCKAIGMILLGSLIYFLLLKLQLHRSGLSLYSNDTNSLENLGAISLSTLPQLIAGTYSQCLGRIWNAYSSYPPSMVKGITVLLALLSVGILVFGLCRRTVSVPCKLLCILLVLLLPMGMAMIYLLSSGYIHELMLYAIWLVYLLPLLLSDWLAKQWKDGKWRPALANLQHLGCMALVLLILYGNVLFANTLYMRKDIESTGYLSLMTRVVARMEEVEGYEPGQTPVTFVGLPQQNQLLNFTVPGFENQMTIVGMESADVIYIPERGRYQAYFDYILNLPIQLSDYSLWYETLDSDQVKEMPAYPAKGFAVMKDGMLIVKLGPVR